MRWGVGRRAVGEEESEKLGQCCGERSDHSEPCRPSAGFECCSKCGGQLPGGFEVGQ